MHTIEIYKVITLFTSVVYYPLDCRPIHCLKEIEIAETG